MFKKASEARSYHGEIDMHVITNNDKESDSNFEYLEIPCEWLGFLHKTANGCISKSLSVSKSVLICTWSVKNTPGSTNFFCAKGGTYHIQGG